MCARPVADDSVVDLVEMDERRSRRLPLRCRACANTQHVEEAQSEIIVLRDSLGVSDDDKPALLRRGKGRAHAIVESQIGFSRSLERANVPAERLAQLLRAEITELAANRRQLADSERALQVAVDLVDGPELLRTWAFAWHKVTQDGTISWRLRLAPFTGLSTGPGPAGTPPWGKPISQMADRYDSQYQDVGRATRRSQPEPMGRELSMHSPEDQRMKRARRAVSCRMSTIRMRRSPPRSSAIVAAG
jgi:hypothetical protein